MNSVLVNQLAGVLRIGLPAAIGYLVGRGFVPAELAGAVVDSIAFLGAVAISGVLDWYSNRGSAVVRQAASEPGVTIEVRPNASQSIKDVSFDPTEYSVVPIK
jgi:hypothetical protein